MVVDLQEKTPVICAYGRSSFTPANRGGLAGIRPDDLAGITLQKFIQQIKQKAEINLGDVEDVKLGCAFPEGEQGLNLARIITFIAGLPHSIAGVTINRFCGSSMQAIADAAGAIAMNAGDLFICGGVESMSRVPMTGFSPMPNPALYEKMPSAYESMGITAENIALQYNISRKSQEEFALKSQQKAASAMENGKLKAEIIPLNLQEFPQYTAKVAHTAHTEQIAHGGHREEIAHDVTNDGCVRADSSLESLASLPPAFTKEGSVTAGTSSPLTDGCAFVLLASLAYAKKHDLPILAKVKNFATSGCDPKIMGIGPVEASNKLLKRAGLSLSDIDVIELNEAFAAQALACIQELNIDESKLNLHGGSIAIGHPLGATGARIVGKATSLLHSEGGKYALATQCIGGGQGVAILLEIM